VRVCGVQCLSLLEPVGYTGYMANTLVSSISLEILFPATNVPQNVTNGVINKKTVVPPLSAMVTRVRFPVNIGPSSPKILVAPLIGFMPSYTYSYHLH